MEKKQLIKRTDMTKKLTKNRSKTHKNKKFKKLYTLHKIIQFSSLIIKIEPIIL